MTKKGRNTPTVRFKGFTDAWEQRKLGEIVTEVNRTDENSVAPVMMITAENGFIRQSERYAYNNSGKSLKKYIILKYGELAYNHGASKLRPYGSCFALTTEKEARIPFVYHCFAANHDNARYLSLVLNGEVVAKQLKRIVSSGARMDGLLNISFEDYETIPIMLPSKEEQDTIVDYFIYIDHLIALHQRQLDEQKALKKYFLQNMFPAKGEKVPRIRFQGFTGDWELRKVQQLIDIGLIEAPMDGNHGEKHPKASDYVPYGIPFLMAADIKNGKVDLHNCKFISKERSERLDKGFAKNGDVLITHKATIGETALLQGLTTEYAVLTPQVTYYRVTNKTKLSPFYLYACFQAPHFQREMSEAAGQSTRAYIGIQQQHDLSIYMPINIKEQEAIGRFFTDLDTLIALHQRQLTQLQAVKKFMLQNLFV